MTIITVEEEGMPINPPRRITTADKAQLATQKAIAAARAAIKTYWSIGVALGLILGVAFAWGPRYAVILALGIVFGGLLVRVTVGWR